MKDLLMSSDEFEEYVLSFYSSDGGIYPFNCNDDIIRSAIHLVVCAGMGRGTFAADSMDREKVRYILEALRYKETQ